MQIPPGKHVCKNRLLRISNGKHDLHYVVQIVVQCTNQGRICSKIYRSCTGDLADLSGSARNGTLGVATCEEEGALVPREGLCRGAKHVNVRHQSW